MKYEAVAQFTVTGGSKVRSVLDLLDKYGLDYVILDSSGTGVLQTLVCEFAILKPEPTEMTPDRLFSFMMKFDEMVRIGNLSHALTPAQIELAKSCDKAKLLKFLDGIWYQVKVSYVKIIAMVAQAYSIAYDKPDLNSGEKNGADETASSVSIETLIGEFKKNSQVNAGDVDRFDKFVKLLSPDMADELMQIMYNMSIPNASTDMNHGDKENEKKGE